MFDDVLWRLIYKWRVLSYRHHWLRLVIPAALTLDMVRAHDSHHAEPLACFQHTRHQVSTLQVHNVYIVAAEWRQRVKVGYLRPSMNAERESMGIIIVEDASTVDCHRIAVA